MEEIRTILIADSDGENRVQLREALMGSFSILEAESGDQALWLIRQYLNSLSVVLLRMKLADGEGTPVLLEMQRRRMLEHVSVLALVESPDEAQRALLLGAADVVLLPTVDEVIQNRVLRQLEISGYRKHMDNLVDARVSEERKSSTMLVETLMAVIESRTLEPGLHTRRICALTEMLLEDLTKTAYGSNLSAESIELMSTAAALHDIGKSVIPDSVLLKRGSLTTEEFDIVKTHTVGGCDILQRIEGFSRSEYLQYAYTICRYHHERWDGSGYPEGLRGESIPLCAQVVGLADCFDMLTLDRVYQRAVAPTEALNMIVNGACGVFAPYLIESLKNVVDRFLHVVRDWTDALPESSNLHSLLETPRAVREDTPVEQWYMKYFALLRYLNETILEVDLQADTFHLIYLADNDLMAMRSAKTFAQAVQSLASCAHPDDRETAATLPEYLRTLFANGQLRQERAYRIKNRDTGEFETVTETAMCINPENTAQKSILLAWRRIDHGATRPARDMLGYMKNEAFSNLINGALVCECDSSFHIQSVNRRFEDLTGYSQEELENRFGNRYIELVYPADRAALVRQFWAFSAHSRQFELEYRIVCKSGRICWISEQCRLSNESGRDLAFSVMIDVTRRHRIEEELRLTLERYRIIQDQTNDVVFEWDIDADSLLISSNWKKRYGYAPITRRVTETIPEVSHLHPEDKAAFRALTERAKSGNPYNEAELRFADSDGQYRWTLVRTTTQFDNDGRPYKAVGVVVDIDDQKRVSQALEDKASRDALTKLYNGEAAQLRVKASLRTATPGSCSALLVLDVDNFKNINDRYGHSMGDAVLKKMAECLTQQFRAADTAARIGGDEFMIYMPEIPDEAMARRRAKSVLESLSGLFRDEIVKGELSCSIGIATAMGGAPPYEELFIRADSALYRAKALGKNQVVCYEEGSLVHDVHMRMPRTDIDSNRDS